MSYSHCPYITTFELKMKWSDTSLVEYPGDIFHPYLRTVLHDLDWASCVLGKMQVLQNLDDQNKVVP